MPSLSSLRAFEAVAEAGDFAGAARALNVTHAAVSQQVRALEVHLGVALAQRAGRSVALTEAGQRLAEGLRAGFGTIADTLAAMQAQEASRPIRVTTTPFIVDAIIMPCLAEFWAQHPGAEVSLQPSGEPVDLAQEGFDLGIRAAPLGHTWRGYDATLLAESPWVIVGAPHFAADPMPDPWTLPWVRSEWMPGELKVMRGLGVDVDGLAKVDVGSYVLHWQAVKRGLGLSLATEHIAREELSAGRLVQFPAEGLPVTAYHAVVPKGPQRAIVRDFIRWLKVLFREPAPL